ncbi:MAG: ribosomal RNA small subunit methyltransferase A [Deltaproteobacteria bacterium]|nr:ribosomal RNA small subunit methyltransferase A [Deltaproteobacteria bacterium]
MRNPAMARKLVDRLAVTASDSVVELGAGQGAMTFFLAERAARVWAVEIDAGLADRLKEQVRISGKRNIEILHQDILKTDWNEWYDRIAAPFFVVGNLPYHISTPILFKLIENRPLLKGAYVMLQKEVADRLMAQAGTKEYGVMAILIGYYAKIRSLMHLAPSSFFPRPKVASTFIELLFREEPTPRIEDEKLFQWVVHGAFGQRRKQIKNALTADGRFPVSLIVKALELSQTNPQCRGETLTIAQFVSLSNILAGLQSALV